MVWTRSQLENLSTKELIDELISAEDISFKLSDLSSCFDYFVRRYEILSSELTVSKNCNRLLGERTIWLERNAVNHAQYHRRESLEIKHLPTSIDDDVLKNSVWRADDPQACHHLMKKDTVIIKFKSRKQRRSIFINSKSIRNKSDGLNQLNFWW